jgi:transcriptional/translational regulatory protein YebC/TACO1
MLEAAIEAGAEDVESSEDGHEVRTGIEDLFSVRDALEEKFGPAESAKLEWRPNVSVDLDEDKARSVLKLIDVLDEHDDVQAVTANFEVSDDVARALAD